MDDELKCPRDGTTLDPRTYEAGVQVDSCSTCRGMFLDAGELEAIQDSVENDYTEDLRRAGGAEVVVGPADPIACPVCGEPMEAREYAYCSGVVVDTCVEGCGIWLDAGEIQALERFFERARSGSGPTRELWSSLGTLLDPGD